MWGKVLQSCHKESSPAPVFDVELLQHHSHPYKIHDVKKEEKDQKSLIEADPGKSYSLAFPRCLSGLPSFS